MFNRIKILAACVCLVILASCGSKQSSKAHFPLHHSTESSSSATQRNFGEADSACVSKNDTSADKSSDKRGLVTGIEHLKGLDIPVPLNCHLVAQEGASFFVYTGAMSVAQARSFYVCELERLGWDFTSFASEQETIFVCHSLTHSCVVSLRLGDKKRGSGIYVFVRLKNHKKKRAIICNTE